MWGVRIGRFRDMAMDEVKYFLREYRDVIYDAPFQFQADMLFVVRAVGMLSGMAANLDPDFDPWEKTIPYAERFAAEELRRNRKRWREELAELGLASFGLPRHLDETLRIIQSGRTTVQTGLAPDTRKAVNRLESAIRRLGWMIVAAALLVSGVHLHISAPEGAADMMFIGLSAVAFFWGLRKG
jgi:predicted unusual protein kinase regulating ubiquinone biosynthesis (AarF/ABC1/UbiB family)